MNANDINRYAALLLQIFTLEEQVRRNPPNDPVEYVALMNQIGALYDEVRSILASGKVTAADIAAAHARNQQQWADPLPQSTAFTYSAWLTSDPGDDKLKSGDHVYQVADEGSGTGSKFMVWEGGPVNIGMPGFPTQDNLIRVVTK